MKKSMPDKKRNQKLNNKINPGREKYMHTTLTFRPKHVTKKCKKHRPMRLSDLLSLSHIRSLLSWILQVAVVILLAFVFVWYFGQKISNVGDSMNPVLSNGDVVLVNQFVYNTRAPKRGDIIAFKPKGNENSHYYIKRVIGLPGESIEIIEGNVYVDGKRLDESYKTTQIRDVGIVTEKIELGGDEYFVLGDDRNRSEDSRMADVGNIRREYIYGKVWFVLSPGEHFGFLP